MAVLQWCIKCLLPQLSTKQRTVWRLSNQKAGCESLCAGAVSEIFHVLYVVSGGGHSRWSKLRLVMTHIVIRTQKIQNC